jgi:hypothetical protein
MVIGFFEDKKWKITGIERAETEYCESRFDVKKLTRMWKTEAYKKTKASFDVCQLSAEKVSSTECQAF